MLLPHFECLSSPTKLNGQPRYVIDEYAFDFQLADETVATEYRGQSGTTSLTIGTLQLEVSIANNLCLYVWGYCPFMKWRPLAVSPPSPQAGSLLVEMGSAFVAGISLGIEQMIPPIPHFNPDTGWFCIGSSKVPDDALLVEFATDTIAAVHAGCLHSLWVKPQNWSEVVQRLSWA